MSKKMERLLNTGLKITGHFGGAVQSAKEFGNNVSYYADSKIILMELMYANVYKNLKGSILIRILDNDLKSNIFCIDDNGKIGFDSKCIVGYVY